MANLVLVTQAVEHSEYSVEHIRYLVRNGHVQGQKQGGIWLVDLDDLQRYEQEMTGLGDMRYSSKRKQDDDS